MFVIADGVGGYGAGDIASAEAVKVVIETYFASSRAPAKALRAAFSRANIRIFDLGVELNKHRMQTTLSVLVIVGDRYHIGHVGDSRIYRVRKQTQIEQLTSDDSEVAELVRMRILAPEKVRGHARRNIITKSVGSETIVRPSFQTGSVRPGDHFILCTDGVWEPIIDAELAEVTIQCAPRDACNTLVRLGLDRQSTDNLSVQIVRVDEVTAPLPAHAAAPAEWWQRIRDLFGKQPLS